MAKTLRQLIMDELGTDDRDKAEALADVVFDWLERIERNGNVHMSDGWRARTEENRQAENRENRGR